MKIVVLSSHTGSLMTNRLNMMLDFVKKGYEVTAVGSDDETIWNEAFNKRGINYRQAYIDRTGLSIFKDIKTYSSFKKIIKEEQPDKLFAYQAKSIIYGNLAARHCKVRDSYTLFAGLGSIFRGDGLKNTVLKGIMTIQYRLACKNNKYIFFHNSDDRDNYIKRGIVKAERSKVVNGSGVNLEVFKRSRLPKEKAFLFVGRLLKDKGIVEYLKACEILKGHYPEIRCLVLGRIDTNPSSLSQEELNYYILNDIIEYYGEKENVYDYLLQCSTLVLPSYHEGRPKAILEAMAVGRAIITTDAPGCKETVEEGLNGFIVARKSVDQLVEKMEVLLKDNELLKNMCDYSYKIAVENYDVHLVNNDIMQSMGLLQ